MKLLGNILPYSLEFTINGNSNIEIADIRLDSRKVKEHDIFVAVKGFTQDGHEYIGKAISLGAKVIVCSELPSELTTEVTYIRCEDTLKFLGAMVNIYYDHPSKKLKLVGVTGTNGKTTTVSILYQMFRNMGHKVGLISTIENKINDRVLESTHTTPDAIGLTALLAEMAKEECEMVFMEVSSHAIVQQRIFGQYFTGAVFTNITHDHLDYHKTFKAYIEAKKMFFDQLDKNAFALINIDDKRGEIMTQNTKAQIYKYSFRTLVDFKGKVLQADMIGMQLDFNQHEFYTSVIGDYNAYNLLCAYSVGVLLGKEELDILQSLSQVSSAEGRMDVVRGEKKQIIAIVDYAHTPDALEKLLDAIHEQSSGKRLIVVVGCGGDRDKEKRPVMARIAVDKSDITIFTSDNPRNEDPEDILNDMLSGLDKEKKEAVLVIEDRRQAIKTAVMMANSGDIIAVAGKGHEKYQEIRGVRTPFDDKRILKALLLEDFKE